MHFHKSDDFYHQLLLEDCPGLDLSTETLGIGSMAGVLECSAKAPCVLAGVEEAARLWEISGTKVERFAANGTFMPQDRVFLRVQGSAAALHRGWKISQNLMEYMSGIATRTTVMIKAARAANPRVHVAVTRKNFPGAKVQCLEAAVSGGALIHRSNLSDSVLYFEQHRAFLEKASDNFARIKRFAELIAPLKRVVPEKKICAEVDRPEDALLLARAGIHMIQCEKFSLEDLHQTVEGIRALDPAIVIVATGGLNGDNAQAYAATGVDVLVTSWVYWGQPADIRVRLFPA